MNTATRRWRCVICGYEHEGPEPPHECPLCGAGPEDFVEITPSATVEAEPADSPARIVIVGGGIAGTQAAKSARETSENAEITLISKETEAPYQRINLTRYLAGGLTRDKLPMHPPAWYEERRIRLDLGVTMDAISVKEKTVTPRGGEPIEFDCLILAVGAHPFVPPVGGLDLEGVSALRTVQDADSVIARASRCDRCVVVGGGILGLEAAAGLAAKGTSVTVLEGHDWLMPRQLDERSGRRLEARFTGLGIDLRRNARLAEIAGERKVASVRLADGTEIAADLVVITTGIRANLDLAKAAGLDVNHGVLIDDACRTSQPDVFAAGDVAEHAGRMYGLWGPAQRQGAVAGINAAGGSDAFEALPGATSLKVLDLVVFSVGALAAEREGDRVLWGEIEDRSYHLVARGEQLAGAVVMGDMKAASKLRRAVESGREITELRGPDVDALAVVEAIKAG